jgi:uncharacterized protein
MNKNNKLLKEELNIKDCEFYVNGMSCASCEITIEKALAKHNIVKEVKATSDYKKVTLKLNDNTKSNMDISQLQTELNELLKDTGYTLNTTQETQKQLKTKELVSAFFIATLTGATFVLLQKLGIVNILNADAITLPFIFLIGIVASLSTCMAVVGGLVLSLSSSYAKATGKNKAAPLVKFHLARIIGFFILGGIMGLLGTAFTLSTTTTFVINLLLFFVMLILGINLLGIFDFTKRLQIRMPKVLTKNTIFKEDTKYLTPVLLGIATFFLPCGFTQSMQFYALTTGSFLEGALTMLVFSLGTLPVLALISIASVKLSKSIQSGLFFKTSGFIVLFFAIFNFLGALVAAGVLNPIFNI